MKFGLFYEHQLPQPWSEGDEHRILRESLEQVQLDDRLGLDCAWEVEHLLLEESSHSSASEVFLSDAAALTQNIRPGRGIRQVISNYDHPARTAEGLAALDLLSNGRLDFGIGEGATRLEFERRKHEELAPYREAALARTPRMQPLADDEIPGVRASVQKSFEPRTNAADR